MNPNDNKYNCACIHRYICMYVHKLEGGGRTIFFVKDMLDIKV